MTFIGVNTNWTYPIENRIIYITKFDVEYCLIINTHNVEVTIVNNFKLIENITIRVQDMTQIDIPNYDIFQSISHI